MTMPGERVYTGEVEYPVTRYRSTVPEIPMRPAMDGEIVEYMFIPEARIPAGHVRFVRRHLRQLLREAGLPEVRLRWYGPAVGHTDFALHVDGGDDVLVGGMSGPAGIALLAGLRGDALLNAIAHEVQHMTQAPDMTYEERERDAEVAGHTYESRVA